MVSFLRLVILVSLAVQAGCGRNAPARPTRFTPVELQRPAYTIFFETFGHGEGRAQGAILYITAGPKGIQMGDGKVAAMIFQPIAGHLDMVLGILYDANPVTDPPPMQLQLLGRVEEDGVMWGEPGDPMVLCDLSQEQVDYVFAHGVPESLIEEMVTAAVDAKWTSKLPAPHRFGQLIFVEADAHVSSAILSENGDSED
ncbi:MAG: hypothetical protein O6933_03745 [Planctomycetota bacterium]|nr:hypothetical protein [Planctomycetota bacterium]